MEIKKFYENNVSCSEFVFIIPVCVDDCPALLRGGLAEWLITWTRCGGGAAHRSGHLSVGAHPNDWGARGGCTAWAESALSTPSPCTAPQRGSVNLGSNCCLY